MKPLYNYIDHLFTDWKLHTAALRSEPDIFSNRSLTANARQEQIINSQVVGMVAM